jgi:hypothetical protein
MTWGGHKKKYIESPEELLRIFNEYCMHVKSHPILKQVFVGRDGAEKFEQREKPLTQIGFRNYCRENYTCVKRYLDKDESYKDYFDVVDYIRDKCLQDNIDGAMVSIYHHGIAGMINNLVKQVENKNINENRNIQINVIGSDTPISNNENDISV